MAPFFWVRGPTYTGAFNMAGPRSGFDPETFWVRLPDPGIKKGFFANFFKKITNFFKNFTNFFKLLPIISNFWLIVLNFTHPKV